MEINNSLLDRARNGDQAAINALIAVHRDELLMMARGKLGVRLQSRIDASDVVQQTCLSVFRQMNEFAGADVRQFMAWVRRIHEHNIQNAVHAHVGIEKRDRNRERSVDGDVVQTGLPTASEHAIRREESTRLAVALCELPPEERVILELRYLDGKTLQEIAHETNLTREAVIWRMQKGMERVRGILGRPPRQ